MTSTLAAFLIGYLLREYLAWITTARHNQMAHSEGWQKWRRVEVATWWHYVARVPMPIADTLVRLLPLAWL